MIEFLIIVRLIAHVVTFASLAFWYKPDPRAETRWGVWFTARIVAGSSMASAVLLVYSPVRLLTGTLIFETLLIVSFAVLVVLAKGDMARLFPRQIWSHR